MLLSMLTVAVLLGAANLCPAQAEMKPLVTVSFSGYDKLFANIGMIGKLGGNPDLGKGLEMMLKLMTQGKGLAGLDTKQPWGAVLLTDGQEALVGYGFLPVTDLKQLMELAKANPQLADTIKEDGGVYEIQTGGPALFVTQKGKWAVIAKDKEGLGKAPADPLKLFGDLPTKYDLAVRATVKNLPQTYREQYIALVQAGMEAGMQQMPGESDDDFAVRSNVAKQAMQQMTTMVNELDEVLLGWNVDQSTSSTYLDLEAIAQKGTKLADQFAQIKPGKTNFAGFLSPKAAVSGIWTGTLTDADVARAKSALADLRKRAVKELENQGLSEDEVKLAAQLLGDVFDVLQKTVESKQSDGGLMLMLDPAALTLVAGGTIADGAKLEKVAKQLVDEIKKSDPETAKSIKLNAETYEGIRFHTFSMPTPEPSMVPFVGDTLDAVVGIADDKVLLAVGRDAAKTLKQVIDGSKAAAGKEVPPMRLTIAATPIAKFAAKAADLEDNVKATAAMLVGALEKAGGKDHITITATPIAKGIRVRLEVEEGLLKLLGSMGAMMGPGAPGGPGGDAPPGE
jgi:hypothetical protein